jgi:hypothetical protein
MKKIFIFLSFVMIIRTTYAQQLMVINNNPNYSATIIMYATASMFGCGSYIGNPISLNPYLGAYWTDTFTTPCVFEDSVTWSTLAPGASMCAMSPPAGFVWTDAIMQLKLAVTGCGGPGVVTDTVSNTMGSSCFLDPGEVTGSLCSGSYHYGINFAPGAMYVTILIAP